MANGQCGCGCCKKHGDGEGLLLPRNISEGISVKACIQEGIDVALSEVKEVADGIHASLDKLEVSADMFLLPESPGGDAIYIEGGGSGSPARNQLQDIISTLRAATRRIESLRVHLDVVQQ